jgi:septum formation protein
METKIILASSSVYRRELLKRIVSDFEFISPEIEEIQRDHESPIKMALRLSEEKAKKIAASSETNSIIIGCDQTAVVENTILQKPMTYENAFKQLQFLSGKVVKFYSAFCVLNNNNQTLISDYSEFEAKYKLLTDDLIDKYLKKDEPYFCVGSIKSESYGITLLESIKNDDPTSIIGLPLIKISKILMDENII